MTVELVYETHSTTTDNEAGIATGWLPGELSALGREQARQLGARRRNDGVAAVFSSDLRRSVETAEIAFGGSGIPVYQDARLRECNYGDLNGAPSSQVAAQRPAADPGAVPGRRELPAGGGAHPRLPRRPGPRLGRPAGGGCGAHGQPVCPGRARPRTAAGAPGRRAVVWQEGWLYRVESGRSGTSS